MQETMKVLEGLAALKIQESRIEKATTNMKLISVKKSSAKNVDASMSVEEFGNNAKASYTSATTLINRYLAIKEAINEFNASTKINVCGQQMTVASAIYLKDYGINQKKKLLKIMESQLNEADCAVIRANGDKLDEAAERNASVAFDGDPKVDKDRYNDFLEAYKSKNQLVLVDPIGLRAEVEKLSEEIANFESSVDSAIQIANAIHDITINY